jgi:hypothetical protein
MEIDKEEVSMDTRNQNRKWFVISIIGLVLVIVGILWITVIFPALAQIPKGYERTYYFDGTFSVLNSETQSMDSFPIEQALAQKATGMQDGALLIHEKRTVTNAATGTDLSAYYGDENTLAIERKTLKFMPTIDERGRTGSWAPPRGLGPGDSFDIWNPSVNKPLTATYVKSEEFRGLKVVVFQMRASDVSLGTNPQTHLPMFLSTTVNLFIEPKTGTVVDQNAATTTSMDIGGNKVPVLIAGVGWTETTIAELVDVAKNGLNMLFWFETVLPWLLIGVGAVLLILGVILIAWRRGSTVVRRRGPAIPRRQGTIA